MLVAKLSEIVPFRVVNAKDRPRCTKFPRRCDQMRSDSAGPDGTSDWLSLGLAVGHDLKALVSDLARISKRIVAPTLDDDATLSVVATKHSTAARSVGRLQGWRR